MSFDPLIRSTGESVCGDFAQLTAEIDGEQVTVRTSNTVLTNNNSYLQTHKFLFSDYHSMPEKTIKAGMHSKRLLVFP